MNKKEQFRKLAQEISTKQKLMSWSPGGYEDTYCSPLGTGEISIAYNSQYESIEDLSPDTWEYSLTFFNSRGEVLERLITTRQEKDILFSDYKLLHDLYHTADNIYMMTDDTLKSMFDDIYSKK